MLNEFLQVLVAAFIGAASGYFINQLPPLGTFRGSRWLMVAVVIELAVLGAIWAWLFGDTAQASNSRGLVEKIGAALLGAFVVNVVQLVWGNLRGGNSPQSSSSQSGTNARTVVRGTSIKGQGNKAKVTQKDVLVENTEVIGKDNEFSVTDDDNSSSPQQNNSPNP